MAKRSNETPSMEKVYSTRNSILGFGLGIIVLLILSKGLNDIFGSMRDVSDKYGELQGQIILNFMRMGPMLALIFCMNGARLTARQRSLLLAIVSALLLSIMGIVGASLLAVLDAIVFRASMMSAMDRFIWGAVLGGVSGIFWGWLAAMLGRVDEKKIPLTLVQFLSMIPVIDRRTLRLSLVGMFIGVYVVVAILFLVVGYGFLGVMMGLAATAVVAIILVNKFNSATSTSGGRNVRQ